MKRCTRCGLPETHETIWFDAEGVWGAGELLLSDADRNGIGKGLNCEIGKLVSSSVTVPVILSRGFGLADHFVQRFLDGITEGVAAGTFFCFRDQNPMQTRAHIRNAGVSIRVET